MYPRLTYDLPILSMDVVANNDMVSKQFQLPAKLVQVCDSCWLILSMDVVANNDMVSMCSGLLANLRCPAVRWVHRCARKEIR